MVIVARDRVSQFTLRQRAPTGRVGFISYISRRLNAMALVIFAVLYVDVPFAMT